jgi:hypothetical protein
MFAKTAAMVGFVLGAVTLDATPIVYAAGYSNPVSFGTIDLGTGTFYYIGTIPHDLNDFAYSGGTLYGIYDSSTLITIDPATGATHEVFSVPGMQSLAFAPDGTLYAASQSGLYVIDPKSMTLTTVGSYGGLTSGQNIRFAGGNLYTTDTSSSNTTLYEIDLNTGLAAAVGPTGFPGLALEYAGGTLYGVGFGVIGGQHQLVAIDPVTGQGTLVLADFPDVNFAEAPEPGAALLCGLGILSLVMVKGWFARAVGERVHWGEAPKSPKTKTPPSC